MDRLESLRQVIDEILRAQPDEEERRCGFVHLYGVAEACVLLALRRGLDVQLCAVAGMLHDIWTYQTGDPTDHARLGALEAERILRDSGSFTPDEIAVVCEAIFHHRDKETYHDKMSELLKDADVLQHYLYNPAQRVEPDEQQRLLCILDELGIEHPKHTGESTIG